MNLEALALARAQEQITTGSWRIEDAPKRRPRHLKAVRVVGGKQPSCLCGDCRKCRNREGMRLARERKRAGVAPGPRGRPLDPSRHCLLCSGPIARRNDTGVCKACQKGAPWRGARRARAWVFSHGGGI